MKTFVKIALLFFCCFFASNAETDFSGERLKDAVRSYLKNKLGDSCEISIAAKIFDFHFQEDGVIAKIVEDNEKMRGSFNVNIEFSLNGRVLRKANIPVKARIFALAPVAQRNLQRGDKISAGDFAFASADVTDYSDQDTKIKIDELDGKIIERPIAKGRVITRSSIAKDYAIKRGENVTVISQANGIMIQAQGKAETSASIGEIATVFREGATGLIKGKAVSNGVVLIGGEK